MQEIRVKKLTAAHVAAIAVLAVSVAEELGKAEFLAKALIGREGLGSTVGLLATAPSVFEGCAWIALLTKFDRVADLVDDLVETPFAVPAKHLPLEDLVARVTTVTTVLVAENRELVPRLLNVVQSAAKQAGVALPTAA